MISSTHEAAPSTRPSYGTVLRRVLQSICQDAREAGHVIAADTLATLPDLGELGAAERWIAALEMFGGQLGGEEGANFLSLAEEIREAIAGAFR